MRLPASVQEIADVIGVERALFLVGKLPHCRSGLPGSEGVRVILYVPKTLKPNHPLVHLLGWHDALALTKAFGGEIMQPASCSDVYRKFRDDSIVRLVLCDGMKPAEVAEMMGVSDRHVRNLLREKPQEAPRAANDDYLQNFGSEVQQ